MGGTSTDVALIEGEIRLTSEGSIGPWPVAVPMVDMHTIGAGGGSIARLDAGGVQLLVNPRGCQLDARIPGDGSGDDFSSNPPPAPFPDCGSDPTVDGLDCSSTFKLALYVF